MKKYTWVLMVIMAVALCGCDGFRSGLGQGNTAKQGNDSAANRPGNQLGGVAGDSVPAVVANKDTGLDNSRASTSWTDDWGDYDGCIIDIKEVRELNLYSSSNCIDSGTDSPAVYTGRDKPDTGDKEVVGEDKEKDIDWGATVFVMLLLSLIVWVYHKGIERRIKELQYQIDKNKDGKLSYDEIKEYVAEKVKDLINKDQEVKEAGK